MTIKTVFIVCIKEDESFLYACENEKHAEECAKIYYDEYKTECVVYEELLRK